MYDKAFRVFIMPGISAINWFLLYHFPVEYNNRICSFDILFDIICTASEQFSVLTSLTSVGIGPSAQRNGAQHRSVLGFAQCYRLPLVWRAPPIVYWAYRRSDLDEKACLTPDLGRNGGEARVAQQLADWLRVFEVARQ